MYIFCHSFSFALYLVCCMYVVFKRQAVRIMQKTLNSSEIKIIRRVSQQASIHSFIRLLSHSLARTHRSVHDTHSHTHACVHVYLDCGPRKRDRHKPKTKNSTESKQMRVRTFINRNNQIDIDRDNERNRREKRAPHSHTHTIQRYCSSDIKKNEK